MKIVARRMSDQELEDHGGPNQRFKDGSNPFIIESNLWACEITHQGPLVGVLGSDGMVSESYFDDDIVDLDPESAEVIAKLVALAISLGAKISDFEFLGTSL